MTHSILLPERPWWQRLLIGCGVAVFWLAAWYALAAGVNKPYLLPGPQAVAVTLFGLCRTAAFWQAAALSLLRVVAGFAAAVVAGCLLAVLTVRFSALRAMIAPLLRIIRCVPVASFILLAFIWIKSQLLPGVIAFLMVLPLIWGNVEKGLRQTDVRLLELARVCRLSPGRTWLHIRIPSVMPYLLPAMTTGLGFAWKSGVAAEVIGHTAGSIGQHMYEAKLYIEMPELFAWTVLIVVLSLGIEALLTMLLRRVARRFPEVTG